MPQATLNRLFRENAPMFWHATECCAVRSSLHLVLPYADRRLPPPQLRQSFSITKVRHFRNASLWQDAS